MTKQVQMTFKVTPELRANFTEAANQEARTAAQILRDFMHAYIASANEHLHAQTSQVSSEKRQAAISFAKASIGLEGFKVCAETEAMARRFSNGEIDFDEFMQLPSKLKQAL